MVVKENGKAQKEWIKLPQQLCNTFVMFTIFNCIFLLTRPFCTLYFSRKRLHQNYKIYIDCSKFQLSETKVLTRACVKNYGTHIRK